MPTTERVLHRPSSSSKTLIDCPARHEPNPPTFMSLGGAMDYLSNPPRGGSTQHYLDACLGVTKRRAELTDDIPINLPPYSTKIGFDQDAWRYVVESTRPTSPDGLLRIIEPLVADEQFHIGSTSVKLGTSEAMYLRPKGASETALYAEISIIDVFGSPSLQIWRNPRRVKPVLTTDRCGLGIYSMSVLQEEIDDDPNSLLVFTWYAVDETRSASLFAVMSLDQSGWEMECVLDNRLEVFRPSPRLRLRWLADE